MTQTTHARSRASQVLITPIVSACPSTEPASQQSPRILQELSYRTGKLLQALITFQLRTLSITRNSVIHSPVVTRGTSHG